MFLINSRSHLVSSTSLSLGSKSHHQSRRTFSRSYGAILPSSFTQVLSSALVFSTRPPVSVWGTVPFDLKLRSFSWKQGINHSVLVSTSPSYLGMEDPDLPGTSAYLLRSGQPSPVWPSLLRHSVAVKRGTGILTCFPSITSFDLTLGADSPCAD